MKTHDFRNAKHSLLLLFLCTVCLYPLLAAEQSLSQLSDEQLVKILWRDDAKAEFERRLHTYSQEQRDELTKKLQDEKLPRTSAEDLPPDELLDIFLTSQISSPAMGEVKKALEKYYENASIEERKAFKVLFVEKGMGVPVSAAYSEASPVGVYGLYANLALSMFPEEDALDILESLYIEREVFAGVPTFISTIQTSPSVKGAKAAKRLEALYGSIEQYPANMLAEEPGALRGQITVALGSCGEAGLDVLEAIGWDSEAGAYAVAMTGTARARELLLARYHQLPRSQERGRLTVLAALCRKLYASDELCRTLVRQDLPQFLVLPESNYHASNVNLAVDAASQTADPYFIPALDELLSGIQSKGLGNSTEATYESPSEIRSRETGLIERITKLSAKLRGAVIENAKPAPK